MDTENKKNNLKEESASSAALTDEQWMRLAIREAKNAAEEGEVPVGAVLIDEEGNLLAASGNRKEREKNPLKHAEAVVLDEGIRKFGKYLTGCTLYVTLEPCAMCAGAAVNARLARLVFGAYDKKGGAAGTSLDVFGNPFLNHAVAVTGGVLWEECAEILSEFFKRRREEKKCF